MIQWLAGIDWSIWYAWIFTFDGWISLITLSFLEIILGIDNLVFLTIASQRLPKQQRARAQRIGLSGALLLRVAMLSMLVWLTKLKTPITTYGEFTLTWSDVIFILGGVFLLWKGTTEIHQEVEGSDEGPRKAYAASFLGVIAVIMVIDFVFALDSIITAVGDAGGRAACRRFHRKTSDHQDAGPRLYPAHRPRPCRRRHPHAYSARLHLLRHRLLSRRRNPEHAGPQTLDREEPPRSKKRLSGRSKQRPAATPPS
jgi:hypothetical protein